MKTNEIPTGPSLLKLFNLENIIVTFDALNTQEETIKMIVKQKGYYVAAIKGNQGKTHEDLIDYFNDQKNLNIIKKFCLSILKLVKELYGLSLKNIKKSLCMDFENEINKIFTYLDTTKIRELVNSTNFQCL